MSIRRHLATSAAAVLLAAAPCAAAAADPPSDIRWVYPVCMRATLSGAAWDAGAGMIVVTGTAERCRTLWTLPGFFAGYRIATYVEGAPTAEAAGHNVRIFPAGTALDTPVPFGAAVVPAHGGVYGVCVIRTTTELTRTCAAVTVTTGGTGTPAATVQPISSDAPLVRKPLDERPYAGTYGPPDGFCGSCF